MNVRKTQFLAAVLGPDGCAALVKAAERSEILAHAVVPRTILAWLGSEPGYEGDLPGVEGTFVAFTKNEGQFSGSVTVGEELYRFENESIFHVAAGVAVALGVESERIDHSMRNTDIQKLGKTIDLLARTRMVNRELRKAFCPGCISKKSEHREGCEKAVKKEELDKGGTPGTGLTAAPTAPVTPTAPIPAGATPPKATLQPKPTKTTGPAKPAAAKPAMVKFTRSEASHRCTACGIAQFKNDRFLGCICFRGLQKSARVVASDAETLTVELKDWDRDAIVTLFEAVGRK